MRIRPLLLPILLLTASLAEAADPFARGFDVVPLKVTPTMDSLMIIDGAELAAPKSFELQALLDFNWGILGLRLGDKPLGDLLPFRADLHIMGAYTFNKWLEVGADLAVTGYQSSGFHLLREQGFDQPDPHAVGLDAPRLFGRFNLLSQEDWPIGLAGIDEVRIPIGDGSAFMGDRGLILAPRIALERRFGFIALMLNVGWKFTTSPGQYLNLYVGQEFTTGLGAKFALPNAWKFSRNEVSVELNLATPAEAPFTFKYADALKTPFEVMVGWKTHVYQDWGLVIGLAKGLGTESGYGRETFRLIIGARYEHVVDPDRDGDGVPDRIDECPDVPGPAENHGCPVPDTDRDGDGIPDRLDACPDEVGPAEYDGCPDRDGDQIPDNVDKCPDEPGAPETEGCPVPQEEEVTLESDRIRVRGNILFETGKANIQQQSYKILDDVAKVLLEHPDVGPVLIEGHTDNRGSHAYNLDLSNHRAAAVEDYLVAKGIDRSRLRSQGFSYDRPVATNDTPLGRAKNRRTEFRLITEDSLTPGAKGNAAPPQPGPSGGSATKPPAPAPTPSPAAASPATPAPAAVTSPATRPDAGTPGAKPSTPPAGTPPKPNDGGTPAPVAKPDGGVAAKPAAPSPAPVAKPDGGTPAQNAKPGLLPRKPAAVDGGATRPAVDAGTAK